MTTEKGYAYNRGFVKIRADGTLFGLNAITDNIFDISDFKLEIENSKLEYLLQTKTDNLEKAGMANLSNVELESVDKMSVAIAIILIVF